MYARFDLKNKLISVLPACPYEYDINPQNKTAISVQRSIVREGSNHFGPIPERVFFMLTTDLLRPWKSLAL